MIENESTGSTFSSSNSDAFFLTNNFNEQKDIFGYAFVLKDSESESIGSEGQEILSDDSIKKVLKDSPEVMQFFKENKTVIPESDKSEISTKQLEDFEKNIDEIEDKSVKSEVQSLFQKVKDKAIPQFAKLFIALGLFIAARSKTRTTIDSSKLEFTNSMPLNFNINNFSDQNIFESGATQSMSFYYTGSTASNV